MATSSCPKCGGHVFEVQENSPQKAQYKFFFVQCASCGTVVGVVDYFNIGAQTQAILEALKKIASKVGVHLGI